MSKLSRRSLLKGAGLAGATTALAPALPRQAPAQEREGYLFFTEPEAAFVEAAVDRLIPADDDWAGALEAGVPTYIDRQLGGPYGQGHRLYLQGPWRLGTPQQGYQLRLTPAELYRTSLRAIDQQLGRTQRGFVHMNADDQDGFLKELETGDHDLGGFPSSIFFETLLANTIEGFLADPAYGGNRDKVSWRMIGFPGAYAAYHDLYTRHGMTFDHEPMGMDEIGHAHHMPPKE